MHPAEALPSPSPGHQVPRNKERYKLKDRNRDTVDGTVPQTSSGALECIALAMRWQRKGFEEKVRTIRTVSISP